MGKMDRACDLIVNYRLDFAIPMIAQRLDPLSDLARECSARALASRWLPPIAHDFRKIFGLRVEAFVLLSQTVDDLGQLIDPI